MTMDDDNSILPPPKRTPWNKGKLIGAKPPLLARLVKSHRQPACRYLGIEVDDALAIAEQVEV
jgi:hypothetical protein